MNKDECHRMFKDYVNAAEAIETLYMQGIIREDESLEFEKRCLYAIVDTMRSEIEK